ncbi:hypothetical protein ACU814_06375 [Lactobacillus johnsonii]
MKSITFIQCLNIFLLGICSWVTGILYHLFNRNYYYYLLTYLSLIIGIDFLWIYRSDVISISVKGNALTNTIFILMVIYILIKKAGNILLIVAIEEEILYRVIGYTIFALAPFNKYIGMILVIFLFLINHLYIIFTSKNRLFSFIVLGLLNLIITFSYFYICWSSVIFIHVLYDYIVLRQKDENNFRSKKFD